MILSSGTSCQLRIIKNLINTAPAHSFNLRFLHHKSRQGVTLWHTVVNQMALKPRRISELTAINVPCCL